MPALTSEEVTFNAVENQIEVTDELFEEQLARVRAGVKDPVAGLFGPDSMMWKVGKHMVAAGHGSGRALLLQIAHPWVTQGIDEHSVTREDPIGRGRRTFRAVFSIVYGSLEQAEKEARRVNRVHKRIQGVLEKQKGAFAEGSHYLANEAHAMLWVHATLWETLVRMYEIFVGELTDEEKEQYYQESKLFAYMFGIPEDIIPPDWTSFLDYNESVWQSDMLTVNDATRSLYRDLFTKRHVGQGFALDWILLVTAVNLPEKVREGFGMSLTDKDIERYECNVKRIRRIEPHLPKLFRYGHNYLEANRRIRGLKPNWVTKRMNKVVFGYEELIS